MCEICSGTLVDIPPRPACLGSACSLDTSRRLACLDTVQGSVEDVSNERVRWIHPAQTCLFGHGARVCKGCIQRACLLDTSRTDIPHRPACLGTVCGGCIQRAHSLDTSRTDLRVPHQGLGSHCRDQPEDASVESQADLPAAHHDTSTPSYHNRASTESASTSSSRSRTTDSEDPEGCNP